MIIQLLLLGYSIKIPYLPPPKKKYSREFGDLYKLTSLGRVWVFNGIAPFVINI